jgi:hypothetical protein
MLATTLIALHQTLSWFKRLPYNSTVSILLTDAVLLPFKLEFTKEPRFEEVKSPDATSYR